jgi:uncharacterized membrane protein YccC
MTDPHAAETLREMRHEMAEDISELNRHDQNEALRERVAALDTALQALTLVERLAQIDFTGLLADIEAALADYAQYPQLRLPDMQVARIQRVHRIIVELEAARAVCPGPPEER